MKLNNYISGGNIHNYLWHMADELTSCWGLKVLSIWNGVKESGTRDVFRALSNICYRKKLHFTQLTFTCSKSTKNVWNMFKFNNKNTKTSFSIDWTGFYMIGTFVMKELSNWKLIKVDRILYTPWKHQKTKGGIKFSVVIQWKILPEMD